MSERAKRVMRAAIDSARLLGLQRDQRIDTQGAPGRHEHASSTTPASTHGTTRNVAGHVYVSESVKAFLFDVSPRDPVGVTRRQRPVTTSSK